MNYKHLFFIVSVSLFLLFSYWSVAVRPQDLGIVKIEKEIKVTGSANTVSLSLKPQDYFLKIKFLNKNRAASQVFFNGLLQVPAVKQSPSEITTFDFFIPGSIVKEANTVKIVFPADKLPEGFDLRIRNIRVQVSNDIYIFSKNFRPQRPFHLKKELLSAIILALALYSSFLILKLLRVVYAARFAAVSILPFFLFLLIIHFINFFSPYHILFDKLYFIYCGAISASIIFFVLTFKKCKKIILSAPYSGKIKELPFIILINLLVLIAILGACELLTRAYIAKHYKKSPFRMEDIYLGCSYTPNYKGPLYRDVLVSTNSMGLRNKEINFYKPENAFRIVCLGDSVTFGFGVADQQTYSYQLEKMLNNTPHKKLNYEVINCGMPAYDTYQERLFLQKRALKYRPNLVILQVSLNDLTSGVNIPTIVNTLMEFDSYSFEDMSGWGKANFLMARNSYLYQYLVLKFRAICRKYNWRQEKTIGLYSENVLLMFRGKKPGAWQSRFREEVLRIKEILKENRINFLLVVFPCEIQLGDKNLQAPQKMIRELCQSNGINCLDLLEAYSLHKDQPLFIDTGHPSGYGDYLAAEEIYRCLNKQD